MLVSFVFSVVIPCASDVTSIFVQKLRPFSGEALSPTEPGVNNPLCARYVSCSELQLVKLDTYLSLSTVAGDCLSTNDKRWNRSRDLIHRPLDLRSSNQGRQNLANIQLKETGFRSVCRLLECVYSLLV